MAQGQGSQGAVATAPDTLPPDFFDKQQASGNAAPDTLPSDFFDKQKSGKSPDPYADMGESDPATGMVFRESTAPVPSSAVDEAGRKMVTKAFLPVAGATLATALFPPSGLLAGALTSGAGGALGSIGGQIASGENPITPENLKSTAETGIGYGAADLGFGLGLKGLGIASRYALPRIAPEIAERIGMTEPMEKTAFNYFRRAVAPGPMEAQEEPGFAEAFNRAKKYIGPRMEGTLLSKDSEDSGALKASQVVNDAKQELWKNMVEPVVKNYSDVIRPVDDVAAAGRASIDQTVRESQPAIARKVEQVVKRYDSPMTVGEMNQRITELNGQKAVSKFYSMSPAEQATALRADPALKAKVAVLSTLRNKLIDTIGGDNVGGGELGDKFREARKDWGALSQVEQRLREARIPAPTGLGERLGGTIRGFFGPHGADFYARPSETLLNLNNPNRLAAKSFNLLGRVGGEAPEGIRLNPFTVNPQLRLPAIGESGEGITPLGGVRGTPFPGPGVVGAERGLTETGDIPGGPSRKLPPLVTPEPFSSGPLARIPGKPYLEAGVPVTTPPSGYSARSPEESAAETPQAISAPSQIQRGQRGRMQRTFLGENPSEIEGQTAEGGPMRRSRINPPLRTPPPETKVRGPFGSISGPPIERTAQMQEANRILQDPLATSRDKAIARQQLRWLKQTAFE